LALVKLLLDPPNLLLMDEPTTHLDVGSIDALIGALKQYHGTLIFISHDVHFIRAIATSVLHINSGRLTAYPGDYQYYIDKSKAASATTALTAGSGSPEVNGQKSEVGKRSVPGVRKHKAQKRLEAEARNAVSKAKREKDQRLHEIETQIAALEAQQKELVAALEDPAVYEVGGKAVAINRELSTVTDHLARLTAQWENFTSVA
jgi:ATP-binding cassette subfamily F protein 3